MSNGHGNSGYSRVFVIFASIAMICLTTIMVIVFFTGWQLWQPQGSPAPISSATTNMVSPLYQWSQIDKNGGLVVRALMAKGAKCPEATRDGVPVPFARRNPRTTAQFDVTVCEGRAAPGKSIELAGRLHQPLAKEPRSIIILGDTGCRLTNYEQQPCNDGYAWPFARIAKLAADKSPDLVIHVGDYHYREQPCADSDPLCAGSPWGDNWPAWKADFFEPAKPLLEAAPWIAVRGNHEDCARAGYGWFQFLSLRDATKINECVEAEMTYTLNIGSGVQAIVVDNSWGKAKTYNDKQKALLSQWKTGTSKIISEDAGDFMRMVLTHIPVWLPQEKKKEVSCDQEPNSSASMSDYLAACLEEGAGKAQAISGHVHNFMSIPVDEKFHQVIVGGGGTNLEKDSICKEGACQKGGFDIIQFNYMHLLKVGKGWRGVIYNDNNTILAACGFFPPGNEGLDAVVESLKGLGIYQNNKLSQSGCFQVIQ